ncbi:MAG: hypothetical protein WA880_04915, partial [Ornithinimicrobium sp.]
GRGWANPAGAVLSLGLCLASLGEAAASSAIEAATVSVLGELPAMAGAAMGSSTQEIAERIAARVGDFAATSPEGDPASLMTQLAALGHQGVLDER